MVKVMIGLLVVLLSLAMMMVSCSSFGSRPNVVEKKSYEKSKQYNKEKGVFENSDSRTRPERKKEFISWSILKQWFFDNEDHTPSQKLPIMKPNIAEFLKSSDEVKTIWLGHSSLLLNFEGKTILLDPVFGQTASPINFLIKRFEKPALELDELPDINYIVISHDHYDHLDMKTIKHFRNKKTKFIVPLGVGIHLKKWGIKADQIAERDWWESVCFNNIEFTAAPAKHFSGRNGVKNNETLWASWILKSENHSIYFSGDSGYGSHFKEIGEKYGPFDVAFIECGQYNESWNDIHMLPEEAVTAFKDLKAKSFFPIHWGMFRLAFHKWYEPVEKLTEYSRKRHFHLMAPQIGQTVKINREFKSEQWWPTSHTTYTNISDVQEEVH